MKKIMITGASGGLGGTVLSGLIKKVDAKSIFALARNPQKLEGFTSKGINVVKGDYDEISSLIAAFKGIDVLYFVSGSDIQNRGQQHKNVVAAAQEAGVSHIIYTSFQRKNETESSPMAMLAAVHIETENQIKASGMHYTILKHALYNSIIPMFLGPDVLEKGVIYLPAGNGKAALSSRTDMAKAAVKLLTSEGHENKIYEISTPKPLGFNEIADIISAQSGKQITYISPSIDEFTSTLKNVGVPDHLIGLTVMFSKAIAEGEFDIEDKTLEKLIGTTETIEDFLKIAYTLS